MLDIYTVSFFGHRQLNDFTGAEPQLEKLIRDLLTQREYVDFLVGRNGEFDQMAASAVLRLKHTVRDDNSSLVLVLPYMTANCANNRESFENYYDRIEVCEAAASAHFKSAIQVRNRAMVDRSDLVICYIERKAGGAYQTIRYVEEQSKHIVNVAGDDCDCH
jgi:hypothetical protein